MTPKKDSDPIVQKIAVQKISSFVAPSFLFLTAVVLLPFSFSRTAKAIPKDPPAIVSSESPSFRIDRWRKIQQFFENKKIFKEEKGISLQSSSQPLETKKQTKGSVSQNVTGLKESQKKKRSFLFFFLDWKLDVWFWLKTVVHSTSGLVFSHLISERYQNIKLLKEKDQQIGVLQQELQQERTQNVFLVAESLRNQCRQGQENVRRLQGENRREP